MRNTNPIKAMKESQYVRDVPKMKFLCEYKSAPGLVTIPSLSISEFLDERTGRTAFPQTIADLSTPLLKPVPTLMLSESDAQNFDYFRVVCAQDFSRYFEVKLWQRLVVQAAASEPCILHAVLAIGCLSQIREEREEGAVIDASTSQFSYFLIHYNTAIKLLRQNLQSPNANWVLALLGSLVFIAIEVLQSHDDVAYMHMRKAFAILRNLPDFEPYSGHKLESLTDKHCSFRSLDIPLQVAPSDDLDDLISAFSRLDVQVSSFSNIHSSGHLRIPILPAVFEDLDNARELLNSVIAATQYVRNNCPEEVKTLPYAPIPDHLMQEAVKVQDLLLSWLLIFTKSKERYTTADIKIQGSINILQIHYLVTWINISTHFYRDQVSFDKYKTQFEQIISLGTAVMEADQANPRALRSRPCYMLDIGMVQPLYFVACRCRDPILRRRAINVMKNVREERVNDVQTLTKVAHWIVEKEEEGLVGVDIVLEIKRFHGIELDFSQPGVKCKITAKRKVALRGWEFVRGCIV